MCLHIIIHPQYIISLGIRQGGHQRIMLAEIAEQIHTFHVLPLLGQSADHPEGAVS